MLLSASGNLALSLRLSKGYTCRGADRTVLSEPGGALMSQTKIRVEPNSVKHYGTKAQGRFENIRRDLVALVNDVATVHYFGPNATNFKKGSAELAADFSARLLKDLTAIANAVRTATSSIAGSLGGQPISIQVNGSAVPIPAISHGDGAVDVDLSALDRLMPVVRSRFSKIDAELKGHLADLRGTDWTGNAKTATVDGVTKFTTAATHTSAQAQKSLVDYINHQIEATRRADR